VRQGDFDGAVRAESAGSFRDDTEAQSLAWLRLGPNQRKKRSRVFRVRFFPIHSRRLAPGSIW
jgi:hypothetical protein